MKRAVVLNRQIIAAIVTVAATIAAAFGVTIGDDLQAQAVTAGLGLVSVVSGILAAISAHQKVTPVADPRTTVAVPLVPAQAVVFADPIDSEQEAVILAPAPDDTTDSTSPSMEG